MRVNIALNNLYLTKKALKIIVANDKNSIFFWKALFAGAIPSLFFIISVMFTNLYSTTVECTQVHIYWNEIAVCALLAYRN
jgi:hypothetical protein